ncbi:NAD-dependent epimerase/dehydratase family protein [Phytoactinopolyspora halotolerans]|uniref:NAD(P)-dependent oxidoreductase n=1 Tax=Phytoactinopolyspora halotolerans TaxID=1981512 RepID=A0A6L9S1J5_9ACTN|nr:NAD(P)-dependent oxidoreductase [Phytoactinopolyspora halotolerans]NED98858.1 NAD(P)-dependent oxidoreductase [Phytoactinopolyspora halotolerans]
MKIFLAGATGVIGRHMVPGLVKAGHEVAGTTRDASKAGQLRAAGAEPVVLDALDRNAVLSAVRQHRPDVVIHQLTAIGGTDLKRFDEGFAVTNELRTRGLDYLLEAAQDVDAGRFIAQSFTGWTNPRTGASVKDENDPLDDRPARGSVESLKAIRHTEEAVTAATGTEGLVLRYGFLYGPGTALGPSGDMYQALAARKLPIVGGGTGIFSFVHVADAAAAAVVAVDRGDPGVYNIVDDEPVQVAEWLPHLARTIGAKPPRRVPAWLAKPMIGEFGVAMMTAMRGSSNAKARRELGWEPAYPSWREGFPAMVR